MSKIRTVIPLLLVLSLTTPLQTAKANNFDEVSNQMTLIESYRSMDIYCLDPLALHPRTTEINAITNHIKSYPQIVITINSGSMILELLNRMSASVRTAIAEESMGVLQSVVDMHLSDGHTDTFLLDSESIYQEENGSYYLMSHNFLTACESIKLYQ